MSFPDTFAKRCSDRAHEYGLSGTIHACGAIASTGIVAGTSKLVQMGIKERLVDVIHLAKSTSVLTVAYIFSDFVDAQLDTVQEANHWSQSRTEVSKFVAGTTICTIAEVAGTTLVGASLPSAAPLLATGFALYNIKRLSQFFIETWTETQAKVKAE